MKSFLQYLEESSAQEKIKTTAKSVPPIPLVTPTPLVKQKTPKKITDLAKGLHIIQHGYKSSAHEDATGNSLRIKNWENLSPAERSAHEKTATSALKAIEAHSGTDRGASERRFRSFRGNRNRSEHIRVHRDMPDDVVAQNKLNYVQKIINLTKKRERPGQTPTALA